MTRKHQYEIHATTDLSKTPKLDRTTYQGAMPNVWLVGVAAGAISDELNQPGHERRQVLVIDTAQTNGPAIWRRIPE